jgi:hypothetical protein
VTSALAETLRSPSFARGIHRDFDGLSLWKSPRYVTSLLSASIDRCSSDPYRILSIVHAISRSLGIPGSLSIIRSYEFEDFGSLSSPSLFFSSRRQDFGLSRLDRIDINISTSPDSRPILGRRILITA